jgi:3'-5' exoribonuclease
LGSDLAKHYDLDRDIVVAGALLHDLGKIWELEGAGSVSYTDRGRLVGHLVLGVMFLERMLADLPSFPAETRLQLLHVLLAHHGEYEFGSPRRPKTAEALLVHLVDNLDSRMAAVRDSISMDHASRDAWTPTCRMLERPIYRKQRPRSSDKEPTS